MDYARVPGQVIEWLYYFVTGQFPTGVYAVLVPILIFWAWHSWYYG